MKIPSIEGSDVAEDGRLVMQSEARAKLEAVIQEQGIKPLDPELLGEMSNVWPADENVDEFLAARSLWRSHATRREWVWLV